MLDAIVYPVMSGNGWTEQRPPIAIDEDTEKAAIKALRAAGYRVVRGGARDARPVTADMLRARKGDDASVARGERECLALMGDDAEITAWAIEVRA